ncbi:MAG TPA: S9 family peptidase [Blastocatellia bacterium]|jgi:dipeptidyl aminopeptidase/acylaminoacyl peptidase|nr:S9 family peptidase [Blastocatellia bacterium]
MKRKIVLLAALACMSAATAHAKRAPVPEDMFAIKDVGGVRISPDGSQVVYVVTSVDRERNGYVSNLWLVPAGGGAPVALTTGAASDSTPRWSPDGKKVAFASSRDGKPALWVVDVATKEARMLAPWERSNSFLSKAEEMFCWSPDGKEIAFVAAEKPAQAESTDPRVITRLQYKTRTSFSDNLRSHIFIVSVEDGKVRQLTRGKSDEHSISWSPQGNEILFLSNRAVDPDANLNYDIFAVEVTRGKERRITDTPGVEFSPAWSPDGNFIAYTATKRKLTTIDSIAEDAHVWVIGARGGEGVEISAGLDRRASAPQWSADGERVLFLAGDRGRALVYSVGRDGGDVSPLFERQAQVSSFSVSKGAKVVFTMSNEATPAEIYGLQKSGELQRLTSINSDLAEGLSLVKPENIRFKSFDGAEVEGWLMRPANLPEGKKCPMILTIHGGPHGMYGYGFNHTNQVYAARGYAVLYLNPRGSTGYGQKFSDGTINEWGGGDYQDLMKGVDYALEKYKWVDENRLAVTGGSYGGFMTNWVITQTPRFKVAVASASLSNLISFYATSLYQDLIHVEFKGAPWENYDLLWKYSPLHYVKNVSTPTMFIHGEQDNDVHITQAEEMYMALRRRGVEAVMVRYPREGHGLREPTHRLDQITRTLAWFDRFIKPNVE